MADKVIVYKAADTGTVVLPSDMSSVNTVICLGAGAGGSAGSTTLGGRNGNGGSSGGIHIATNVTLTASQSVQIQVGTKGTGGTLGSTAIDARGSAGGSTWLNGASLAAAVVGAQGGQIAADSFSATVGGASFGTAGGTKTNGSAGGAGSSASGSGSGAGAPGTTGAGGAGVVAASFSGGSGGGAADGGTAGSAATNTLGAAGGTRTAGSGGAGGAVTDANGAAGVAGNGGGGGASNNGVGGAGSFPVIWTATDGTYAAQTFGPGSGGGGGGSFGGKGGAGSYGAGGGGAFGSGKAGGDGGDGLIIIIYTPAVASPTTTTFGGGMAIGIGTGVSFPRTVGGVTAMSPTPTAIPDISPAIGWTGTAGSVGGAPTDPSPRTTAKPSLLPLTPINGLIVDSNDLIIGVHSWAGNGNGPVATAVSVWIEGNSYSVPFNSYTYTDANGNLRTIWGYFARLKHSAFIGNGAVNVYWTSDPTAADATMQKRVYGPVLYTRVSAFTGYDYDVQVGAGLTANGTTIFNTDTAALNYLRSVSAVNPRLRFMEDFTGVLGACTSFYQGGAGMLTIEVAAGKTVTLGGQAGAWVGAPNVASQAPPVLDPNYNGVRFKGSNLRFDMDRMRGLSTSFNFTTAKGFILDGCDLGSYSGVGAFHIDSARRFEFFLGNGPLGTYGYKSCILDDTYMHDSVHAFIGAWALVRNARVKTVPGDCTQIARNIYGFTCEDLNSNYYRDSTQNAAFTIGYVGASTSATVEKSGANGNGTITFKENGVTKYAVDTTTFATTTAMLADFAAKLGASGTLSTGWTFTPSANIDKLDSGCIYYATYGGVGPFTAQECKNTTIQISYIADIHGDIVQPTVGAPDPENLILCNIKIFNNQTTQEMFFADVINYYDAYVINYAAGGSGNTKAQWLAKGNSCHMWHCTFADEQIYWSGSGDMDSRCSVKGNLFRDFELKVGRTYAGSLDSNFYQSKTLNSIATSTNDQNAGGTIAALITAHATGDFSPKTGGGLATITSLVPFDLNNAARGTTSHIGAVA